MYSDEAGGQAAKYEYVYDGWGNLIEEYQEHDGTVDGGTPYVEYAYDDGASGAVAKGQIPGTLADFDILGRIR